MTSAWPSSVHRAKTWDSRKDSTLATPEALLASLVIAIVHAGPDRDFAREWFESLRLKHPDPMGEEQMLEELDRENGD